METIVAKLAEKAVDKALDSMNSKKKSSSTKPKTTLKAKKKIEQPKKKFTVVTPKKVAPVKASPSLAVTKKHEVKETRSIHKVEMPSKVGYKFKPSYHKTSATKHKGRDAHVVTGTEFFGFVKSTNTSYKEIFNLPINPIAITGTRLQIMAILYQKFKFKFIRMEFIPAVGTSTNGQLMLTHIDDPEISIPPDGTLSFLNTMSSIPGAVAFPPWSECEHKWSPSNSDPREFYINPDVEGEQRFTSQGEMKVIEMTPITVATLGSILIHYEVLLYEPIVSISNISTWSNYQLVPSVVNFIDNGPFGQTSLVMASSASSIFNYLTLYAFYLTFTFGGLRAFEIYFVKTPGGPYSGAEFKVYRTAVDAVAANGEFVGGSFFAAGSFVPSNGAIYFSTTVGNVGLKDVPTIEKTVMEDHDELQDLLARVDALTKQQTPNTPRLSEKGIERK